MLVSVIIPAFNREQTIKRAVDSVLSQTWKDLEVIVVDDGSVDQTANVVAEYGSAIQLIRQENLGPSAARNAGIKVAKGEVISFLDSDDAWLPEKTERQVMLLRRVASLQVSCCICNATMLHADGFTATSFGVAGLKPKHREGIWLNPTQVLLSRFLFFNQVVAVRREVLAKVGLFRPDLRILEDYDLALRLSLTGPWGVIADPLMTWHGGTANSLSRAAKELDVHRRTYEILNSLGNSPQWGSKFSQPALHSRLRALRRGIWAGELSMRSNRISRITGRLLIHFLRFGKAIQNRLPSYPRMLTRAL